MLFVVAAVAVAGAAIGPMFLQSADNSVLASTIANAPPGEADVTFLTTGGAAAAAEVAAAAKSVRGVTGARLLSQPIYTADIGVAFPHFHLAYQLDVLWRSHMCAHLQFVAGSCPTGVRNVAVSQRSAAAVGARLGTKIDLHITPSAKVTQVTVTGIYLQPSTFDDAYWGGVNYFGFGVAPGNVIILDPLVTTEATDLAVGTADWPVQFVGDLGWRPAARVVGKVRLESLLAGIQGVLANRYGLSLSTGLPTLIGSAQGEENLMSAVVLVIVLQLVVLALLVLYALGRATASARRLEADFARRRGFSRSALLSLAVGEPLVLITLALPVGVALAWATVKLAGASIFISGTAVAITPLVVLAAIGGYVAAIGATTLASYVLWHRSGVASRTQTASAVLDAFAVALALAGLIALATHGSLDGTHANPLAALAPGLLALGAGVIGLRLMAALVRLLVRASHESRHVAWFLALRRLARRPEVLRRLFPLAAATGIVLFAVGTFVLATENRNRAAGFETGADRIVNVTPPPGLDLVQAVRQADPSGHEAMAVALDSSPDGELLAVDSQRFAAVASWPVGVSSTSVTALARRLYPPLSAPVTFHGERLRATIAVPPGTPSLDLDVTVFDEQYDNTWVVIFRSIRPGVHTYTTSLDFECLDRCRLASLSPGWYNANTNTSIGATFEVRSLSVGPADGHWQPVDFGQTAKSSWISETAGVTVSSDPGGVPGLEISSSGLPLVSGAAQVAPDDVPPVIPAVVTGALRRIDPPSGADGIFPYEGLDGSPLNFSAVSTVPALPAVGSDAALVDLTLLERAEIAPAIWTNDEVWLAPGASPSILASLRRDGVAIGSTVYAGTNLSDLNHAGLALAYDLALIVTPIAALLAIGAIVFALAAEGRRRRHEITSLATVGVTRREIRRAFLAESVTVLFGALVVGGAIGFAADALTLSSLPESNGGNGGLALLTGTPVAYLFAALGGLAVALVLAASITSRLIIRQAFSGETIEQR